MLEKVFWEGVSFYLFAIPITTEGARRLVVIAQSDFATRCTPGGRKYNCDTENSLLLTATGVTVICVNRPGFKYRADKANVSHRNVCFFYSGHA